MAHTIAAVKLQRRVDDALGGFGGVELGHGRFPGDAGGTCVTGPGGAIDEQGGGVDLQCHVGDVALHHLQFGERGSAGLRRFHTDERFIKSPAGKTQSRCANG